MSIPPELARVTTMVFDVDGTLTDAEHHVSDRVIESLQRLDAVGVRLVIASGRAPASCSAPFERAGLHGYASSCNGALVADIATGEVLRRVPVPPEMTAATIDLCLERDLDCCAFTEDAIYVARPGWLADFLQAANEGVAPIVLDLRELPADSVLKLMPSAPRDLMAEVFPLLREICPDASLSLDETCEVIGPGAEKADGVGFLLDHLGIDPAEVAGFGDGGNDVAWLRSIGWPIAMANARDEVKAVARLEIGHHLDDGVPRFVDEWLAARS